jgi:SAM-dependent methyltransferase
MGVLKTRHVLSSLYLFFSLPIHASITSKTFGLQKIFWRQGKDDTPFCYTVTSSSSLSPEQNFLATQVWPSSRMAASFLIDKLPPLPLRRNLTICELGCGPGLPSLIAANAGVGRVIASDLEPIALELVHTAARDQNISAIETMQIDLCSSFLPDADIYLLCDVFESGQVAKGAARLLHTSKSSHVWVFCQSDRAQREIFLEEMRLLRDDRSFGWISIADYNPSEKICLFSFDESEVKY